jgi:predicted ATPase
VVKSTLSPSPAAASDRLYLVNVSGVTAFRPIYDALSGMGFYNLNPEEIRDLQPPDPGELLNRDGSNIASVLANLGARSPELKKRIEEYLAKVVPGVAGVDSKAVGPKETLEFRQDIRGAKYPWRFLASNMSDGTLRALGVLVALFQGAGSGDSARKLVGIEEPEVALHPAAAGILTDSFQDASEHAQILVTSHSPDLLDNESIPDESILAVVADAGETQLGPLDEAGRSALRDRLYTAGELLRMDQLRPDPRVSVLNSDQVELFGPEA